MPTAGRSGLARAIVGTCSAVLWVTTAVIFLILTANTVLRYIGGTGLQWANELPELLFPWLVMAGVVLAAEKGGHIATVFLMEALPAQGRRLVATGGWLVVALLYAVLARATWAMLPIVHDEVSPILHVPGSVTYACVLGGMAMLSLLALQSAWGAWRAEAMPAAAAPDHSAPGQATHW